MTSSPALAGLFAIYARPRAGFFVSEWGASSLLNSNLIAKLFTYLNSFAIIDLTLHKTTRKTSHGRANR